MIKRYIFPISALFMMIFAPFNVWAQMGGEDIGENLIDSASSLPGLISAFLYILGILFTISGLFKLKEHLDNEKQVPIKSGFIRLIVAGLCFALPFVYATIKNTINGGADPAFDPTDSLTELNALLGDVAALASFGTDLNSIFENFLIFNNELPGVISALAYLLGLLIGAAGVIKIKEHVEEPEKVPIREAVGRLIIAGALFALPAVFEAAYTSIVGSGMGAWEWTLAAFTSAGFLTSSYQTGAINEQCVTNFGDVGLGNVLCMSMISTVSLPSFLAAISYMIGLVMGLWGIMKIRDHVLSPTQTKLHEGVSRLLTAGAFFGMPVIAATLQNSLMPAPLAVASVDGTTGYAGALVCDAGALSLDQAFGCFVDEMLNPSQVVLNFFSFCAGLIFVMIGISRMIRSAQDGPRGPGGLGTIATFITGGILMSGTATIAALSASLFGESFIGGTTATNADIIFVAGMSPEEVIATQNLVSAVVKFMIIVGMFSFIRGIFILRETAEGKGQASVMSGVTHIVGGALAVNIGPLANAVQASLGVDAFGIVFN